MTDPETFVHELYTSIAARLAGVGEGCEAAENGPQVTLADLLKIALKKELEATEEAALWLVSEPDVEVKLALARQCGDEAKHYRLIENRLRELGVPTEGLDPLRDGHTPMFQFLAGLTSTVERVAAGQFTREAIAEVHNRAFIEYCVARGDHETAALYRDVIQPDEAHHHALGRKLLLRLAISDDDQRRARAAAERTLAIAEELTDLARLRRGIACAPGC